MLNNLIIMTENVEQVEQSKNNDLVKNKSVRLTLEQFDKWDNEKPSKKIRDLLNKGYFKNGDVELLSKNVEHSSQFKSAFKELYTFFKEITNEIQIIVPTKQGMELWNEKLSKKNRKLISEMGRLI